MNADPWIDVAAAADLPRASSRRVIANGEPIALFRASDGAVFALLDRCPHKGGPLSDGIIHGHAVSCPLHNWSISLETGEARAPDAGCTRRFPLEERDGRLFLAAPRLRDGA